MKYGWTVLAVYLLALNLWGTISVCRDKRLAQTGAWRIPEKRFFLIALLGGCPGVYLTMRAVRHKTQHLRFMIGLPLIFAAQCTLIAALYFFFTRA